MTFEEVLFHVGLTEDECNEDLEGFYEKLDMLYLTECLCCERYVDKDEYYPDNVNCELCK